MLRYALMACTPHFQSFNSYFLGFWFVSVEWVYFYSLLPLELFEEEEEHVLPMWYEWFSLFVLFLFFFLLRLFTTSFRLMLWVDRSILRKKFALEASKMSCIEGSLTPKGGKWKFGDFDFGSLSFLWVVHQVVTEKEPFDDTLNLFYLWWCDCPERSKVIELRVEVGLEE